jgi:predicted porin
MSKEILDIKIKTAMLRMIKVFGILLLTAFLCLGAHTHLTAQNQEVTVIAPYKPTLSDVVKKSSDPQFVEKETQVPAVNYSIQSQTIPTSYTISTIKPSLIDVDSEEELRRNYLRAGFGNYTTPYFELFTNSLSSDDFSIGFHARHLSSKGDIDDYAPSAFSQNNVSLNVKRYLKEKILSGRVYYDRDVVHYYGFEPAEYTNDTLSDEDLRQRFSHIGADFEISSNKRRNDELNYMAGINFYHLSDVFNSQEMKIGLKSNLNTKNEFFDFVESQELGTDINFDFYNNTDSLNDQSTLIGEIAPYIRLNIEFLDLTLGARAVVSNDTATNFYLYPEIKASYQIIPNYLRFFANITGGLHRNSYRSVSEENPWVDPRFALNYTSTKYSFKGGLSGKLNNTFDYNFSVAYSEIENLLLFNNDFLSAFSPEINQNFGNKFTGLYDDAQITTIAAELSYQQSRFLDIMLRASYNDYQMSTQAKPWHKPAVEAALSGKYLFSEKVSFRADLFFNSKTYAQVIENGISTIEENKAYVDLNLGAEYRFSKNISAFVSLNNVTATRYFRWYNYPSQRINVMGGLTFAF